MHEPITESTNQSSPRTHDGGAITHTCQPATIFAFLLVVSRTNFLPQAVLFSPSHSTPSNLNTLLLTHSPNTRRPSKWNGCWCPPKKNRLAGGLKASKDPTRMKEGAIRVAIQAASTRSRQTSIPGREIKVNEREVGIPNACIASVITPQSPSEAVKGVIMPSAPRNSRIEDRVTAKPSALREYGVLPAPFNCISVTSSGSLGWGVVTGKYANE